MQLGKEDRESFYGEGHAAAKIVDLLEKVVLKKIQQ